MIASKEYVLQMLEKEALFPKRKFSQNFLINEETAKKIISLLNIKQNEIVLEIGPGLGALSEIVLINGASLICYEIDQRMCEHLKKAFAIYKNFKLIDGDFLKQKIEKYNSCKVVSNLPYALTTPIIEKIILEIENISCFVFMVQKEVSERLEAKINTKEYSPLSIILQHIGILKKEILVKKNEFFPIPNIDSLVYKIDFYQDRDKKENIKFYKFLKQAFKMRRKTLLNNLSSVYEKEKIKSVLEKNNLIESIRPEQISYEQYLNIFHELTN